LKPRRKAIAALALLLAGGARAAANQDIDACSLLQAAEIAHAVGRTVDPGLRMDAGAQPDGAWSSSCVWLLRSANEPPMGAKLDLRGRSFVMLNAMQWPAGSGKAGSFLDGFRDALASGVLAGPLSPRKFGDEAFWWGDGLAVRRRDTSFGLSVRIASGRAGLPGAAEEQLAPHVLRRIDARDARLGRIARP
jgi:hypothetical protein